MNGTSARRRGSFAESIGALGALAIGAVGALLLLAGCGGTDSGEFPSPTVASRASTTATDPAPGAVGDRRQVRIGAAVYPMDESLPTPVVTVADDRSIRWTSEGEPGDCYYEFRRGSRVDGSGWRSDGSSAPRRMRYRTATARVACRHGEAETLSPWGSPEPEPESSPAPTTAPTTGDGGLRAALDADEWTANAEIVFYAPTQRTAPQQRRRQQMQQWQPAAPWRSLQANVGSGLTNSGGWYEWTPTEGAAYYRVHKRREAAPGVYFGGSTNLPNWEIGSIMGYPGDYLQVDDPFCVTPHRMDGSAMASEVCYGEVSHLPWKIQIKTVWRDLVTDPWIFELRRFSAGNGEFRFDGDLMGWIFLQRNTGDLEFSDCPLRNADRWNGMPGLNPGDYHTFWIGGVEPAGHRPGLVCTRGGDSITFLPD